LRLVRAVRIILFRLLNRQLAIYKLVRLVMRRLSVVRFGKVSRFNEVMLSELRLRVLRTGSEYPVNEVILA
jgi:hypothetical protein